MCAIVLYPSLKFRISSCMVFLLVTSALMLLPKVLFWLAIIKVIRCVSAFWASRQMVVALSSSNSALSALTSPWVTRGTP